MSLLKKAVYTLLPILLILMVVTNALSYLGVGADVYAIYLIWILASTIFYMVLPSKQSLFEF